MSIDSSDRFAIQDLIASYVYAMDTGNAEAVTRLFTRGAECRDVTGTTWDAAAGGIGGFTKHFLKSPMKRGGQHYFQVMNIETPDSGTWVVRSFWSFSKWDKTQGKPPTPLMLGQYTHTVVKADGHWHIAHMVIEPWVVGDRA